MIKDLINLLDENLSNATALLMLVPSMTPEEQIFANSFISRVVENTSLLDLKEKEILAYMKLYLKTRIEASAGLEELINDTQRQRLKGL